MVRDFRRRRDEGKRKEAVDCNFKRPKGADDETPLKSGVSFATLLALALACLSGLSL